jgi:hypothetical protein
MRSSTRTVAGAATRTDVVATEVDEHDVFGQFLLVLAQLRLHGGVGLAGRPAGARASDGPHLHLAAVQTHQALGRGAGDDGLGNSRWNMYGDGLITRSSR